MRIFDAVLSISNFMLLFFIIFILSGLFFIIYTWGQVDFSKFMFFVLSGVNGQIDRILLMEIAVFCFVLPIVLTVLMMVMLKKFHVTQYKIFGGLLFFVVFMGLNVNGKSNFWNIFSNEKTDFYEKRYVSTENISIDSTKRNLIVIFVESLNENYSKLTTPQGKLRINDEDAVKFDYFIEGFAQNWTQGALFSAFTGIHIHYLSNYFRYKKSIKDVEYIHEDEKPQNQASIASLFGRYFDFKTPNIYYLGDILAQNGYQNIFVQSADAIFSGTDKFLKEHGFKQENIYDLSTFKTLSQHQIDDNWWGTSDAEMFELFKQKISSLDKNKPFLSVAFTLDLHKGNNPYFKNFFGARRGAINNLNDFIEWFKKQEFYDNTTLIIIADHQRMEKNFSFDKKLYNAFFNLPENLKDNLDTNRKFSQIDLFPTILEILGFELPQHKAGLGVSLFSKEKTIAEEFSFQEQIDVFMKHDDFYINLWQ